MDISDTLAPNSDQLDAIDLIGNPRTFTITDVSKGNPEQPVQIHLAEFPRVWRPGKSMRRVLAACWGTDATVYIGRRVTLFCDESVRFGNDVVGGTRISHLSHIDKPRSIPLLVSRKKSAMFRVDPLPDAPTPPRADPSLLDTSSDLAKQMYAAIKDSDIPQAEVMVWISNVIGRDVDQTKQMTPDEASQVIAGLQSGGAA